jgi:hypothetical protein
MMSDATKKAEEFIEDLDGYEMLESPTIAAECWIHFKRVIAENQSLQRRCEAAESILERLVAWDECFPKGTIHAYRAEEKHDGIVNDARKLLAPTE